MKPNPCVTCGACCASFRVSFHWSETDPNLGGLTPSHLTTPISPHLVAMRGTESKTPRCIALSGEVGQTVSCVIYQERSSTCREFQASWENGQHEPTCDKARQKCGLAPLEPPA